MQKIEDGRAFAQEFGVRYHVEVAGIDAVAIKHPADPLVGVDRNRALLHDYLVAGDGTGNLRYHGLDIGEVSCARFTLRSAYGNENGLALLHCAGKVGCKIHPTAEVFSEE